MNWKKVSLTDGAKLFKVHSFAYDFKGSTYHLEVDEYADGNFTGHGEHSADKNRHLASVTSKSLEDCLNALIKSVKP